MKKSILLLLTLSLNLYAQSYEDFDNYIHSVPVTLPANMKLTELLKENGYDLKERDWSTITMHMNKLTPEMLQKRDTEMTIYLLPKISYEEYANSKTKRTVASIEVENKSEKVIPIKNTKIDYSVGVSYGNLAITQDSTELSMNFAKLTGSIDYKLNSRYTLQGHLSGFKPIRVKYSESNKVVNPTEIYPEFGAKVMRSFQTWDLGLAYDHLNYFVLGTRTNLYLDFEPEKLHKLSLKSNIPVNDKTHLLASAGHLRSFTSEEINGFDISLGAAYRLDSQDRFKVSGLVYQSRLNTAVSKSSEISTAYSLSLVMKF